MDNQESKENKDSSESKQGEQETQSSNKTDQEEQKAQGGNDSSQEDSTAQDSSKSDQEGQKAQAGSKSSQKGKAKVRSFRVTDEVMDKLRDVMEELSLSQDKTLEALINAYEADQARYAMPEMGTAIDDFRLHVNELTRSYLASLQQCVTAEDRVKADVQIQLQTMSKEVKNLTDQLSAAKAQKEEADKAVSDAQEKIASLEDQLKSAPALSALSEQLEDAKKKAEGYDGLKKKFDETSSQYAELKRQHEQAEKDYKRDLADKDTEIARTKEIAEKDSALAVEKAVSQKEREMMSEQIELQKRIAVLEAQIEAMKNA